MNPSKTRAALAALALGAGLTLAACAKGVSAAIKVGEAAPAFTLSDALTGEDISLEDFRGSLVVLEWHNKGCPYVKKHYWNGDMQSLQKDAVKNGVVWLSVISSAEGKQGYMEAGQAKKHFAKVKGYPTAVLLDSEGAVGRRYGARTTPHMYIVDADGVLRYNGAIDSIRSRDPDDVPKAENYVRSALEALKKGEPVEKSFTKPYGCSVKY